MSSSSCAALLVIVACVVLQALDLSLQLRADNSQACLHQHRQAVVCVAWPGSVETPARAG
ncbi:hypothetical protein [Stenotrophomonas sp. PFBMAA-4]|uniref:hypothetical protein n=1 Tax=Stenotrophomonas sp. PFBMAA-4 TaxID=3043301 RepID=UPI0024B5E77C|nr:hypothetical protein [Stenotrophomonas sp. PFBMAA-4]MDI9274853.1 hypothetical protein [Stenotrophomonas sp. PFBMAA-4]